MILWEHSGIKVSLFEASRFGLALKNTKPFVLQEEYLMNFKKLREAAKSSPRRPGPPPPLPFVAADF
jgi:hypothetical protein